METKQKTLAECKDEVARNTDYNVLNVKFENWKHFYNHCRVLEMWKFYSEKLNEAAELYAGQTKQSAQEVLRMKENELNYLSLHQSILESQLKEYFPQREMSFHDKVVFAISSLIEKKSSPVSLEVEKSDYFFYYFPNHGDDEGKNCWTVCYGNEGNDNDEIILTTETEEWDAQELCGCLNKIISEQSKQPASIAFLSDEEIQKFVVEHRKNGGCTTLACDTANWVQSELRKRVIDLNDFAGWLFGGHDKNVEESIVNDYINSKTK